MSDRSTIAAVPRPRARQKQRTRAQLIRAAFQRFSSKGVAATTTAEIAKAARVSHGALFLHFPTRDDLVAAVIGEYAGRIVQRIHELVGRGAGVRDVLAAHLEGLSEHEAFYARLVAEGPILPPYARTTQLGLQSVISHHLALAAESEARSRRIRSVPLHLLFNTWLGLVHHYLINRDLFAPGESVLLRCGDELLNHYMGLLAP